MDKDKEIERIEKKGVVVRVEEDDELASIEKVDLIRSEPGHHLSSLFKPLQKKKIRDKRLVKWTWKFKEKVCFPGTILEFDELEYEFRMYEELGEDDLKVFLRLVQVAGVGQVVLDPWMEEYEGLDSKIVKQLRLFSSFPSQTENSRTMPVVRSDDPISYNAFLGPILKGRFSKKDKNRLERSLKRLASTTVFITAKKKGKEIRCMGSNLVSFVFDYVGYFIVAVNPFVAQAILGNPLGGYTSYIDGRVFKLKGISAVLLSWLSAWLGLGKSGRISLDKLEEKIYGDKTENKKNRYKRRRQLRKALQEINELEGWKITEIKKGIFEIKPQKTF